MSIAVDKEQLIAAYEVMQMMLAGVKVQPYASVTRSSGSVDTSDPKSEGVKMADSGMVSVKGISSDGAIEFTVKSKSARDHGVTVSTDVKTPYILTCITAQQGNLIKDKIEPGSKNKKFNKIVYAVDHWLLKNTGQAGSNPETLKDVIIDAFVERYAAAVVGPVGCGKTRLVYEIKHSLCEIDMFGLGAEPWDFFSIVITPGSREEHLCGSFGDSEVEGKSIEYKLGPLTSAVINCVEKNRNTIFYADETNRGRDVVQGKIQELLTDVFDPATGEKYLQFFNADLQKSWLIPIEKKPGRAVFRFLTTMNMGDRGVTPISDALRRRFNLFVEMDYLSKEQEVEILFNEAKKRVPREIIEGIVDVANDVRQSFKRGEPSVPHTADTGTLIDMVKLLARRTNPRSLRTIKEVANVTLIKKIAVYEATGYAAEDSVKANVDLLDGKLAPVTVP